MLYNPLIFALGGVLAAAYFGAPKLFASKVRTVQLLIIATLYLVAIVAALLLFDLKTAFVVCELGVAFTVLGKLLAINFDMVHRPNYPKQHRCY